MIQKSETVAKAEEYYDSTEADSFYRNVWGGEDIHIGVYESPDEDIAIASRRIVDVMAGQLAGLGKNSRVIDLGAGYGGAARRLASKYGCKVTCVNLSQTQNAINADANEKAGLSDLIDVTHGSFEDIQQADGLFDVAWSQDAILHSGDRARVLDEIHRVLKPGGQLIFTDPMQRDDCPPGVLQPILDRIHLTSLASFAFYRDALASRGFVEVAMSLMLDQMRTHYVRVGEELKGRYDEIVDLSGREYVDNMLRGLDFWVSGADSGYLAWGTIHFRKE